jgi:hypothetical protein
VRLKKRLTAPENAYAEVKSELLQRLTREKQQKKLTEWVAEQRGRVKIDINKQMAADLAKETAEINKIP